MKNYNIGFTLVELVIVLLLVGIAMVILNPVLNKIKERSIRIACADNMRVLSKALFIYAKEHDGNFSESLKTLYDEKYISDTKLLDCPGTLKIGGGDDPDYFYTKNLSVRNSSDIVLISEKPNTHAGGENIVYVNSTIAWEKSGQ
ncbi:protein containing Prepilin-type cleavage/methylation [Candidatus Omnitrophus magneticus]|uniref:Protein containing Prepilin-type cleavage/methylation n=1 Tax=Candidatus Omnitrophus magneticus TaxID=1609969 RepID=A0A0F0CRD2_9BACT|nr:protein containing Prepilin-type cleavage/methylation [Candidatus Omnitrophus magneticus]